jgi:transposase-like protein
MEGRISPLREETEMEEQRKRLTARRKFELYLETRQKDANVGEILRRYGVHLNDLRQIEGAVERAATAALTGSGSKAHRVMTAEVAVDVPALRQELARKEQALAELMVEHALLKKSERSGWRAPSNGSTSMASGARR